MASFSIIPIQSEKKRKEEKKRRTKINNNKHKIFFRNFLSFWCLYSKKGKSIPVTGRGGP
jgi:hypothetical protein